MITKTTAHRDTNTGPSLVLPKRGHMPPVSLQLLGFLLVAAHICPYLSPC